MRRVLSTRSRKAARTYTLRVEPAGAEGRHLHAAAAGDARRPHEHVQPARDTDTLKHAENDSPGATVPGECRSASAGAVIGSKQMTSEIDGAKICA